MEAPAGAGGNAALPLKMGLRIISKVEFNPAIFHLKDLAKCLQFTSATSPRTVMSSGFEGVKYWAACLEETLLRGSCGQLEKGMRLPMLAIFSPVFPWLRLSSGLCLGRAARQR